MSEATWKVTYHYANHTNRSDETMIVRGWKPILQLVKEAQRDDSGVIRVDVGPKIGPPSVTFVMIDKFVANG
jgi:hypothetical protein